MNDVEIAQLYATLRLDSSQYTSGLASAKQGLQDTGKAAADAGKQAGALGGILGTIKGLAMAAFSFEALRRGTMGLINTASAMEQYRTRLRAVIDTAEEADATFQRIKDWAAFNPVNTDEAIESFVLLRAAAVDNTEVAVKAVGNLAKVMGRDMRDVAMALVGLNTMQMRRLGILLDQTGSKATIQIGKIRREVIKDVGAIRAALIEMIEEAYGRGMEMAKDTYRGIIDTLGGQFQNFKVDLAGMEEGGPFRTIVGYLKELSDEFDKWQKSEGYKEFIKNFQELSVALIKGAVGVAKFTGAIISSDITTTLIKWGVGIKVVIWGFEKLLALGTGIGAAFAAAGTKASLFGGVLGGVLDKIPWLYKVLMGAGAAGIGAGIAVLSAADDKTKAVETLSERQGLGDNKEGQSQETEAERKELEAEKKKKQLKTDIERMAGKQLKDFVEGEKEYYEALQKELAQFLGGQSEDEIGKSYVKAAEAYVKRIEEARAEQKKAADEAREAARPITDKIMDPLNEALRIAQKEFNRARDMAKTFGLDTGKVLEKAAENAKDQMDDIMKKVLETYGPGGIMVIAEKMRQFDTAVPGLKKIADAIEGIETKAKGAKEQLSELNSQLSGLTGPIGKVFNAMKKGFFKPEDFREVGEYLKSNLTSAMETIQKIVKTEFPGASESFRKSMAAFMGHEVAEGFGLKRLPGAAPGTIGAGTGTRGKVEVELSPAALKGLSDATVKKGERPVTITINQYGFNIKSESEARKMGRISAEGVRLGLTGAQ